MRWQNWILFFRYQQKQLYILLVLWDEMWKSNAFESLQVRYYTIVPYCACIQIQYYIYVLRVTESAYLLDDIMRWRKDDDDEEEENKEKEIMSTAAQWNRFHFYSSLFCVCVFNSYLFRTYNSMRRCWNFPTFISVCI